MDSWPHRKQIGGLVPNRHASALSITTPRAAILAVMPRGRATDRVRTVPMTVHPIACSVLLQGRCLPRSDDEPLATVAMYMNQRGRRGELPSAISWHHVLGTVAGATLGPVYIQHENAPS